MLVSDFNRTIARLPIQQIYAFRRRLEQNVGMGTCGFADRLAAYCADTQQKIDEEIFIAPPQLCARRFDDRISLQLRRA
jgi:hypothetical protein